MTFRRISWTLAALCFCATGIPCAVNAEEESGKEFLLSGILNQDSKVEVRVELAKPDAATFPYSVANIWFWGFSTFHDDPPRAIIKRMRVLIDGREIWLPFSAYADLAEVHEVMLRVGKGAFSQKQGFSVEMLGSDGGHSYDVEFRFDEYGALVRRWVRGGSFPKMVWDETRYMFLRNRHWEESGESVAAPKVLPESAGIAQWTELGRDGMLSFSGVLTNGFKVAVRVETAAFDERNFQYALPNSWWGVWNVARSATGMLERKAPKSLTKGIFISYRGKSLSIPFAAYAGLTDIRRGRFEVEEEGFTLKLAGGEGDAGYDAALHFDNEAYLVRHRVRDGRYPHYDWEETRMARLKDMPWDI